MSLASSSLRAHCAGVHDGARGHRVRWAAHRPAILPRQGAGAVDHYPGGRADRVPRSGHEDVDRSLTHAPQPELLQCREPSEVRPANGKNRDPLALLIRDGTGVGQEHTTVRDAPASRRHQVPQPFLREVPQCLTATDHALLPEEQPLQLARVGRWRLVRIAHGASVVPPRGGVTGPLWACG